MSFNLIDEPWIPVTLTNGSTAVLSLGDCLAEASSVRKISAELPTQSFALLRVLLAICHDAIGIHDESALYALRQEGLPTSVLLAYLERYRDRFDLLHPERPFMQVASLRTAKGEAAELAKLIADVPNGDPFLTTRGGAALKRITFAEAARWVVHCQAFDPSGIRSAAVGDDSAQKGKAYPIGPSWAGQIGGLILHGRCLAETISFNLTPVSDIAEDMPVWALEHPQSEQRQIDPAPTGPVSLLVWQSRRIRLIYDEHGVTGLVLAQGDKMTPQNRIDLESMTAWRYSSPQTKKAGIPVYMPLKHDPARAGWRGMPALLVASPRQREGHEETLPPHTVTSLTEYVMTTGTAWSFLLEQIGMAYGANESTVAELFHDVQDLHLSILAEEALPVRMAVDDAVRLADSCVWVLGRLASNLARAAGDFDSSSDDKKGPFPQATLAAWAALEAPARQWLSALDASTDINAANTQWQRILRDVLESHARRLLANCSPSAVAGRKTKYGFMSAATAELIFRKALRTHLSLAFKDTTKESEND